MAKKVTIENKLCEHLISLGYRTVLSRSKKYSVYTSSTPDEFYFVGRGGALRKGRTATESFSLEGATKDHFLKQWEAAHSK